MWILLQLTINVNIYSAKLLTTWEEEQVLRNYPLDTFSLSSGLFFYYSYFNNVLRVIPPSL